MADQDQRKRKVIHSKRQQGINLIKTLQNNLDYTFICSEIMLLILDLYSSNYMVWPATESTPFHFDQSRYYSSTLIWHSSTLQTMTSLGYCCVLRLQFIAVKSYYLDWTTTSHWKPSFHRNLEYLMQLEGNWYVIKLDDFFSFTSVRNTSHFNS